VTRSEVTRLLAGECLEETIYFAPEANAKLTYAMQLGSSLSRLELRYAENRIKIWVPSDSAHTWGATDQVGIAEEINLGDRGSLALLIEKDFACLDRSQQENEDTFPNPNAGGKC
jgi:hypothetical protein